MAADESAGKEGRLYTFGSLKTGEGLYCQSTFCVLKGRFFAQYRDELDEVGCHIILVILRLPSNSPNRSTKTYGKMSEMCKLSVCYQIERSFLTGTLFARICSYNASYPCSILRQALVLPDSTRMCASIDSNIHSRACPFVADPAPRGCAGWLHEVGGHGEEDHWKPGER